MKNIVKAPDGLIVTVTRQGKVKRGYVAYSHHKDMAKALAAAQVMRERFIKALPPSARELGAYRGGRSNTGVAGITACVMKRGEQERHFMTVSARPRIGQVRSTKFYFDPARKGEREEALRLAIEWRTELLRQRQEVAR